MRQQVAAQEQIKRGNAHSVAIDADDDDCIYTLRQECFVQST
jgi:hypothetical protein